MFVLVKVFQLIVSGVIVSKDEDEVKKVFKEYTGVDYDEYLQKLAEDETLLPEHILGEDYDQTKIYELPSLCKNCLNEECDKCMEVLPKKCILFVEECEFYIQTPPFLRNGEVNVK